MSDSFNGLPSLPPERNLFKTIMLSAITAAIISIGTVYAMHHYGFLNGLSLPMSRITQVPDISNLPTEKARKMLQDASLRLVVDEETPSSETARGVIVKQRPQPGSDLTRNEAVHVVVSSGLVQLEVPNVIGKTLLQAQAALKAAGLSIGTVEENAEGPAGTVVSLQPAVGTSVAVGSSISIQAAAKEKLVQATVPSVLGMSLQRARQLLTERGIIVGKIRYSYDDGRSTGLVLHQDPKAETQVDPKATIDLIVNEEDW